MKDIDRGAFGEAMLVLSETFNEPVSDVRVEAYFDALKDFSIMQVNLAVRRAVRDCRFFPKPVELRELIEGQASDNADAAWSEVMQQIRRVGYMGAPTFSDERILRTVNELWGGWRRLCETLPGEGPELLGWVKQFKAAYAAQPRREQHAQLTGDTVHPNVMAFIQGERKRLRDGA